MTKRELIEELSDDLGFSKLQTKKIVQKLFAIIQAEVKAGNKVTLSGFGTFYLGKRAARAGINPINKKKINLDAVNLPRFRAGTQFKESVKKSK